MKNDKFAYWLAAAVLVAGVSNNHRSSGSLQLRQVVASVHARANFLQAKVREKVGLVKCLVGRGALPNSLEASERLLGLDQEAPSMEAAQLVVMQARVAEFSSRNAMLMAMKQVHSAQRDSRLADMRTTRFLRVVRFARGPVPISLRIVGKSTY